MSRKKKQDEKIQDFTSLATFDAATAKEGQTIALKFQGHSIRRMVYGGKAYCSVIDVCEALAEPSNARRYWSDLKRQLAEKEGFEQVYEKIVQLKLPASDGKMYATDCAGIETVLRIIESIPSPKAEPFKQWLAQVGFERIEETVEPGRGVKRAVQTYRDQGRPDDWIDNRLQQAAAEGALETEWVTRGVTEKGAPVIRKAMHRETFGIAPSGHREVKKLRDGKTELADHMTGLELALDRLGKEAAKEFCIAEDTKTQKSTHDASVRGAKIAGGARVEIEKQTGKSVVSSHNFLPKPAAGS